MSSLKNATSIISKGFFVKGEIVCNDFLEVEGKIEGVIQANEITIRECGSVKGELTANVVNIKGSFDGDIKSKRVNISGKASIKGKLEYISLCVEDGASIEGDLKRINENSFNSQNTKTNNKEVNK